jgi:O-antigen/teichoic acid export membrane protein
LLSNVVAAWIAHGMTLMVGFVMPRLIYEAIGLESLGLWDLGWSLVMYIGYAGLGTGATVTHFLARRTDAGEAEGEGVRAVTASAWYVQLAMALLVSAVFVVAFRIVAEHAGSPMHHPGATTAWMAGLLGATILVALLGDVAQGVLYGCHLQGVGEYVSIASDIALAIAMIAVLAMGGSLVGLAAATLLTRTAFETLRFALAFRAQPQLSLHPRDVDRETLQRIVRYSVKTTTGVAHGLLVQQLTRLALAVTAGPAMLACYSRYATLVRQIARLADRTTLVVPSLSSSLAGMGREAQAVQFGMRAANATALLLFPMAVGFAVFGTDLVSVWMGPEFAVPGLSAVLAVTAVLTGDRTVANGVLSGLNAHGRISVACLFASLGVFAVGLLALAPLDPLRAGILVTTSTALGITLPHFVLSCRRFRVPISRYFREVFLKPLISNIFFLLFLVGADRALHAGHWLVAIASALAGAIVLALTYWLFAFDAELRAKFRRRFVGLAL